MYVHPSKIDAQANNVDGETSVCPFLIDASKFSVVSFTPSIISAKRYVFADHKTITLSSPFVALNVRMSLRI
jgi:hypothetical protein